MFIQQDITAAAYPMPTTENSATLICSISSLTFLFKHNFIITNNVVVPIKYGQFLDNNLLFGFPNDISIVTKLFIYPRM